MFANRMTQLLLKQQAPRSSMMMLRPFCMQPVAIRQFSASAHDKSDDTSNRPSISLDDFYADLTSFSLTDSEALDYMTASAKMGMVSFKD